VLNKASMLSSSRPAWRAVDTQLLSSRCSEVWAASEASTRVVRMKVPMPGCGGDEAAVFEFAVGFQDGVWD
jgi:hypothetical protein